MLRYLSIYGLIGTARGACELVFPVHFEEGSIYCQTIKSHRHLIDQGLGLLCIVTCQTFNAHLVREAVKADRILAGNRTTVKCV